MLRGLLIKDGCVLMKQLKVFFLMMILFALYDSEFTRGFALMYVTMMPITAMAFDEQSKWNYYAQVMPYRERDMVLSKYLIGLIGAAAIGAVEAASAAGILLIREGNLALLSEKLLILLLVLCCSIVLMAINLPLVFKLGSEKGRLVYLVITVVMAVGVVNGVNMGLLSFEMGILPVVGVIITALVLAVSILISVKVYKGKYQ